jgi:carbonic anhydrase
MHPSVLSCLLLLTFSLTASGCLYKRANVPFTYTGETGHIVWHGLSPTYSTCATGKQQSPIDVTSQLPCAQNTTLLYPPAARFEMENNGHTILLTPKEELLAVLNGRRSRLLQFHFHVPSEHRLDNEVFPMEVHFVHEDVDSLCPYILLRCTKGNC